MARAYDVVAMEKKWQQHWEDEGTYQIDNDDPREKFYALCMYPYPSGPAHQGFLVEAMGLEPTNLLTASQALYQLSYAPSGEVRR